MCHLCEGAEWLMAHKSTAIRVARKVLEAGAAKKEGEPLALSFDDEAEQDALLYMVGLGMHAAGDYAEYRAAKHMSERGIGSN